jgi:3-oxoacyl-(acyl-carrier-protein) synthase
VLETESHARARNAGILGRLCSCAYSTETSRCSEADLGARALEGTVARALKEANIGPSDIGHVCCNSYNGREKNAIESVLGKSERNFIDCTSKIGFAEATQPLYNMSYALLGSSFEKGPYPKYILVVFSSDIGNNCATIIRKE